MDVKSIANRLVELCRKGQNMEALEELYADNIVSIEPKGAHNERVEGKDNVREKSKKWYDMVEEIHGGVISNPVISSDHFSCSMEMDVTFKGEGRVKFDEIAVYKVANGKIVQEEFFYSTQQ